MRKIECVIALGSVLLLSSATMAGTLPVTGAFFHFDAEEITAANLDGTSGFIATWPDSTGNGHDAVQSNTSNQPELIANGSQVGDRQVVRFDDTDRLVGPADLTGKSGATAFLVAKQPTNTDGTAVSSITAVNGVGREMSFQHEPSGGDVRFNYRVTGASNGGTQYRHNVLPAVGLDWVQQTVLFDAGSVSVFHNYSETPDSVATSGGGIASTVQVYAQVLIGALDLGSVSAWDGDIAEIVMFDTALSATDMESMHDYLEAKWTQPVPEPATMLLLGVGVAAICGLGRRDRK